ncbi:hypothetical protein SERLA73DRAFT_73004 [Serpula lacrymans var. lacrymans S7.3]|uniref:Uncharacterized protein n=2 Tax=Serpula lacrymans var. lacrymans TaxID=341189 RepID=F8PWF5_SERL3|nr:uncharacterized protein SERLADRAFT_437563 [Serpula lacrymans var. lacrymans S7.9]EGO00279.1 hypothetical protein SERLA73DRAFT_73004 [Serpula lacrymans var. lacrymans S7.3]EGO25837.1 hypothetical protein SERLADRAFT_437563 [Serpula lacrymans var. lacrymans S7.9]
MGKAPRKRSSSSASHGKKQNIAKQAVKKKQKQVSKDWTARTREALDNDAHTIYTLNAQAQGRPQPSNLPEASDAVQGLTETIRHL